MKKIIIPAMLGIAALISACNTMPATTSLLEQTRSDYAIAQNTPNVATYAKPEMQQAGAAMDLANAAANQDEGTAKIDQLAYLAKQKIALAQEVGKRKADEAAVANASKERNEVRLEQRNQEVHQARQETRDANMRNAQLEAQLGELRATRTERGMVITLGDVLFGSDLSSLNADGMQTTKRLANMLEQHPQRTVLIEGYTDNTGASAYNRELSTRRASTVRNALQGMGINEARISIQGHGELHPVARNDSAENRQLNRRVEIVLSDANGKVIQR